MKKPKLPKKNKRGLGRRKRTRNPVFGAPILTSDELRRSAAFLRVALAIFDYVEILKPGWLDRKPELTPTVDPAEKIQ